jgi:phospholipid-binding lipoprotein MlaA
VLRAVVCTTFVFVILTACASNAKDDSTQTNALNESTENAAADWEEDFVEFADADVNDPLETPNRLIFAMNEMLDVVILANDVFQGDEERVNTTFARFVINSTLGIAGLFDVADGMGYPFHKEDFGQTLGFYGAGEGFYLVLPIFGPSSARDGTGLVVDTLMDPFRYIFSQQIQLARFATEGVDLRSRNIEAIDELRRDSVDFYARIRSLYRQHRENEINNGELLDDLPVPGFDGNGGQDSSDGWAE